MRHLKEYKIFESDGDLEFPTKEDIEEIETLFLDIADEFDLERDDTQYFSNHKDRGYYGIHTNLPKPLYPSLFIVFNLSIDSNKEGEHFLDSLKHFHQVLKSNFPNQWISYSVNRVKVRAFDMFRKGPERDDVIHTMFRNSIKNVSNLIQIEII